MSSVSFPKLFLSLLIAFSLINFSSVSSSFYSSTDFRTDTNEDTNEDANKDANKDTNEDTNEDTNQDTNLNPYHDSLIKNGINYNAYEFIINGLASTLWSNMSNIIKDANLSADCKLSVSKAINSLPGKDAFKCK